MKRSYLSILTGLLLVVGMAACTNDEVAPQQEFFVSAEKDGQTWDKGGKGIYSKARGEFLVYSPDTLPYTETEVLSLRFFLPRDQSLSAVRALPAEWSVLIGGDVVSNRYQTADSTSLPSLTVTRLDTVQKIVEGRFKATLRRDKHYTQEVQLMHFTKGAFRVHYQEYP
ncbi:MAG TPA: hypothetical protein VF598_14220 [Hymenobacter sp.]|jgi:hypothetical protein